VFKRAAFGPDYLCAVEHHCAAAAAGRARQIFAPQAPTSFRVFMPGRTMVAELAAERAPQVAWGVERRSASATKVRGRADCCGDSGAEVRDGDAGSYSNEEIAVDAAAASTGKMLTGLIAGSGEGGGGDDISCDDTDDATDTAAAAQPSQQSAV
jgi:hypothetical protein